LPNIAFGASNLTGFQNLSGLKATAPEINCLLPGKLVKRESLGPQDIRSTDKWLGMKSSHRREPGREG